MSSRTIAVLIRLSPKERRRWRLAAIRNDRTVAGMVREAVRTWIDVQSRWERDERAANGARR